MINPIQLDPQRIAVDHNDFLSLGSATSVGNLNFTTSAGAAIAAGTSSNSFHGVVTLTGGTTTSTLACMSNASPIYLGNGRYDSTTCVNIPVASGTTDTFAVRVGLNSATDGTLGVDAVLFEYSSATAAAGGLANQWRAICSAATSTVTMGCGTMTAATTYSLRFVIAEDRSKVDFYINDVFVATTTTKVPLAATPLYYSISILKSVGTTGKAMLVDYYLNKMQFTTPRT